MDTIHRPDFPEALGVSPAFLELQERLATIAPVNRPVLLLGERGTGKELAAARLHFLSKRWSGPLIRWNCAACPPDLVESELFGHEAGSFTGAIRRRAGRFESANGGTLFLDELGQMPTPVQEKLLRVLEYGTFERVGGGETLHVDVRIVAATNADLPTACREGRFREDLLDRLACCVVHTPPLRNRKEDIPVLAFHFAARMASEMELPAVPKIDHRTEVHLQTHSWPGNIRELRNVIERAVIDSNDGVLSSIDLDPLHMNAQMEPVKASTSWHEALELQQLPVDLPKFLDNVRSQLLRRVLRDTGFHQRKAATLLGLTYDQFRALYRRFEKPEPG